MKDSKTDEKLKHKPLDEFDENLKKFNVIKDDEPFLIYTKGVKDSDIKSAKISSRPRKKNLKKVINSLLKKGIQRNLDDLNLRENCLDWIMKIFEKYPNKNSEYMKFLLRDFTETMMTRMREEEKYVIGLMLGDELILCHSVYGEKTITPNLDVIERMLDRDNFLRYVCFRKNNTYQVIFYEKHNSLFLTNWLGLGETDAFDYLGGKNKFYAKIHEIPIIFEISDEFFEKKIYNNENIKIEGNTLILPQPVQRFTIDQIKRNRKVCKNIKDFIQDFLSSHYNLAYYQEKYKEIRKSFDPYIKKLVDEDDKLVDIDGKIYLKKTNQNFTIIFCDDKISIRNSFLEKIVNKLLNNEHLRLFHAGGNLKKEPIKIKNLELYNEISISDSKILVDYFEESYDAVINQILRYVIFELIRQENIEKPISQFLEKISKELLLKIDSTFSPKIYENKIIELKSRDFILGKNHEIIQNLVEDFQKKLLKSYFFVYIIGYDEKSKIYEPLQEARFDDSRINILQEELNLKIKIEMIKILRIPYDKRSCVLLIIIKK